MQAILLSVHLVVALLLIGLVMLQKSEGGALGIGGGQSGSLFSSRGVGNTLTRTTAILAAMFFATSIALTMLSSHRGSGSVVDTTPVQSAPADGGGSALLPKLDGGSKPAQPATP
jgi:preprotein translocase subunit SecG